MTLRRYWFEFSPRPDLPIGTRIGCGVTGYDKQDALALLRERVFRGVEPPVERVVEDVDVSTLDRGHVIPNMSPPSLRGVWFPLGY